MNGVPVSRATSATAFAPRAFMASGLSQKVEIPVLKGWIAYLECSPDPSSTRIARSTPAAHSSGVRQTVGMLQAAARRWAQTRSWSHTLTTRAPSIRFRDRTKVQSYLRTSDSSNPLKVEAKAVP